MTLGYKLMIVFLCALGLPVGVQTNTAGKYLFANVVTKELLNHCTRTHICIFLAD